MLHSDERLADFEAERPRLLRLGYRMLGSLSEAEDILQEAWLRWAATVQSVDTPPAVFRSRTSPIGGGAGWVKDRRSR